MLAARWKFLLVLAGVLWLGSQAAPAQFVDPMECLPPTGQGMWEIAATNLARAYREEPTAARKQEMCARFRSTIDVYQKAAAACRRSTCKEASYKKSCARVNERIEVWKQRTKKEC